MNTGPEWLTQGLEHIWLPYTQMATDPKPAAVARTQDASIYLEDGSRLIDGVGSWWTSVHGYNNTALKDALIKQLNVMPHVMLGGLAHESAYKLAVKLAEITPGDLTRSFFCESGSVAVEVAMKIAVQYWRNTKGQVRPKFISFKGGYHGDTLATMSICDPEEGMHALFGPALPKQIVIDLPRDEDSIFILNDILASRTDIAGVIVEPLIQGAGGMCMHPPEVLRQLRSACDTHGSLLIFDEIFTGFYRTGNMFAADTAGITPDIMTIGKALTGGVTPLAAAIASSRVYDAFHDDDAEKALMHGPTFTGHALACAVALESIKLLEKNNTQNTTRTITQTLTRRLTPLAQEEHVQDVRVLGAVAAVELKHDFSVADARARFIDMGVFIRPLGRVIYLTPTYTITDEELNMLCDAIEKMVSELKP